MEKFDPKNEKYKSVEDLPRIHKDEFVNVDGGFVTKEADDTLLAAEKKAYQNEVDGTGSNDPIDVLHGYALNVEKNKKDTIDTLEKDRGSMIDDFWKNLDPIYLSDSAFVKQLIITSPELLYRAPKSIKDDKEIALAAVRGKYGYMVEGLSDRLRDDKDIALVAVNGNVNAMDYISKRLQQDPDIIKMYGNESANQIAENGGIDMRTIDNYASGSIFIPGGIIVYRQNDDRDKVLDLVKKAARKGVVHTDIETIKASIEIRETKNDLEKKRRLKMVDDGQIIAVVLPE